MQIIIPSAIDFGFAFSVLYIYIYKIIFISYIKRAWHQKFLIIKFLTQSILKNGTNILKNTSFIEVSNLEKPGKYYLADRGTDNKSKRYVQKQGRGQVN